MTDQDLALWLQGAAAMIGDRVPTELEWASIKDKVDEVIGKRVAARLLEKKYEPNVDLLKWVRDQQLGLQGVGVAPIRGPWWGGYSPNTAASPVPSNPTVTVTF